MSSDEKAALLDWLCSSASGYVEVYPDGSRSPQIAWQLALAHRIYYGPTPLEALQNAYEASQRKPDQLPQ